MKRPKKIDVIKKQAMKVGYITILSTILILGISYAWLSLTLTGTKTNTLRIGTLSLVLDDKMGEGITIDRGLPMYDEVGLTQVPYTFTLTNNGDIDSEYTIYLDDMDLLAGETRLPDNVIKYNLTRDSYLVDRDLLSATGENPNRVLDTDVIAPGETYTYELKLWLDIDAGNEVMGQVFRGKIRVETSQVVEPIPTDSSCFAYTKTSTAVTITDYKCYEGNPDGMPVITDVAIPRLIEGIEVKKIGDNAFKSKGLMNVDIPRTVTSLGIASFQGNELTSVDLSRSLKSMGYNAFENNKITSVRIPFGCTSINDYVFATNQLSKVIIPGNIKTIGAGAFLRNPSLTDVIIEEGVERIGIGAFVYNGSIINVSLPNSVTVIASEAFRQNKIEKVKLPSSLKTLGGSAFMSNRLSEIEIPKGVTTISASAFQGNQLTKVTIPEGVETIADYAFISNKLTSITIPSSVTSIGTNAFWYNALTNVMIKGKSSTGDFTSFGTAVFGWASGYSDSNITWNG